MKSKLLVLIAASFLFALTTHARAATIDINLTGLGPTKRFQPGCYCSPESLYMSRSS
jgi:hypothetical protein